MIGRVARLELPGRRWYLAVCESCQWAGLSWKDKLWAVDDRNRHNKFKHSGEEA